MTVRLFVILHVILAMLPGYLAAKNYYISWADTLDNGDNEYAWDVALDHTGNFIVTGSTESSGDKDFLTVKYDADGTIIWIDTLQNGDEPNSPTAVAVDGFNNIIVTGITGLSGYCDFLTAKYDSNGTILWVDTMDNGDDDIAAGVAVDNSNNIIVAGTSRFTDEEFFTAKYDPAGNILWADTLYVEFGEAVRDVAVDSEGNIIIVGRCYHGGVIIKYDSAGTVLWSEFNSLLNWPQDITVDHNDYIVITGGYNHNDFDFITVKYHPSGAYRWGDVLDVGPSDCATSVAVDDSNNIIITGGTGNSCFSAKYNPGGTILWTDMFRPAYLGAFWGVAVAGIDDYIMTGYMNINGAYDYFTVNYELAFPDSVVAHVPEPYVLYANGIDSSLVRGAIYDSGIRKVPGMADSLSFHARLGGFYGNITEDPSDTTYSQWYRAGTTPGVDTTWIVCPCCESCDSAMALIVLLPTGIVEEEAGDAANSLTCTVSPNPFCERLMICVTGALGNKAAGPGHITIYDATGQRVRSIPIILPPAAVPATVYWDGNDERERRVSEGVYIVNVSAGGSTVAQKVLLIR